MQEFFHGTCAFFLYIIPVAAVVLAARAVIKIPDELFRKILHFILLGAYIPIVFAFETWWMAAGLAAIFAILIYPILVVASRLPGFSRFTTQRREGEFVNSMVIALFTMALSVSICWGIFSDRYLVLACVYAWGVGDAFAALVGKRFGKHKIRLPFADPHKSVEGSAAMFVTSTAAVWIVLVLRGGMSSWGCGITAGIAAAAATFVELCTRDGYDTVTCPAAAMLVILPLTKLLGG